MKEYILELALTTTYKWLNGEAKGEWTKVKKHNLLDAHRLLHYIAKSLELGKIIRHRDSDRVGAKVSKVWLSKTHEKIVQEMVDKDLKHFIRDDLDRTLTDEIRDQSIQDKVQLQDLLEKGDKYEIINSLTTTNASAIISEGLDKGTPKWAKYLPERHARMVCDGKKTIIVSSIKFKKHLNEHLFLCDKERMYGIITMSLPKEIPDKKTFVILESEHQISESERESWWGEKFPLWYYEVQIVKLFDKPIKFKRIKGFQNFVRASKLKIPNNVAEKLEKRKPSPYWTGLLSSMQK